MNEKYIFIYIYSYFLDMSVVKKSQKISLYLQNQSNIK